MADRAPIKRGGKYCVAGSRDNVSCNCTTYSPGNSMHRFPSDKVLCQKWTSFVRKHRRNFKPSKHSALCSAHFEPTRFTRVASVVPSNCAIRRGCIPTRDAVLSLSPGPLTLSAPTSSIKTNCSFPLFCHIGNHTGQPFSIK